MPRGTRRSFEERISDLDKEIERTQEKLNGLVKEKETLSSMKEEAEMKSLMGFLHEKGVGINEVIAKFS